MIKKSVLVFIILSICASALNYIIYPLFSRILAPEEYINITTSLSLFTQVSTFLSSILAITIGLSKSENDKKNSSEKLELLQAFLFKLFLALTITFLLFSPVIMDKIHAPVLFAIPICTMMLLSIPILVISGYLNGKNHMIKLGTVVVISAGSQFVIGLTVALVSHSGLATMLSMSLAQIVTLAIIYTLFSKDNLPGITKSLKTRIGALRGKKMSSLLMYTAFTSFAIMAISLVQIVDLFIVQSLNHANVKFYTDIYVVSRVVFFAGMIFIWPFLGEISLDHHHFNRKPFIKIIVYFTAITLSAIALLYFFGNDLSMLLFGVTYELQLIRDIGILSVLYKFFLLVLTAIVLYFVVLRSYVAVWLSLFASGVIFGYAELLNRDLSITHVLVNLNGIAITLAIVGIILLFRTPVRKN